jgi:hypothetical protein
MGVLGNTATIVESSLKKSNQNLGKEYKKRRKKSVFFLLVEMRLPASLLSDSLIMAPAAAKATTSALNHPSE